MATTKKRRAHAQPGPIQKKSKITQSESALGNKKRSRPVTASTHEDIDEEDSEDEDEFDEEMATSTLKDPAAARESHKLQKLQHQSRRSQKPNASLLSILKPLWSQARSKSIPSPKERQERVKNLMDALKGNVKDIVLKHDASRIVQTVVKYGGKEEREEIAGELKGSYKELAQSRYSKFLVIKIIRLVPSHRRAILSEFQSHVLRLLLHREASVVLADAFELYANAYERSLLLRDFYGKEVALFGAGEGDKKGLSGVLEGLEGERRKRVMNSVRENLITIFNNPDKGAITHAIVHRVLWEYLTAINAIPEEEEREKLRKEIFEICQEVLAEMVHTKDGSRVVREFITQGSAKDRKQIIKVLKPHVERMATNDEAQLVLFTALDIIDDTKLTSKSLVTPLTQPTTLSTLVTSPQGRRSIFYLLVPRTRRHFTPAQITSLEEVRNLSHSTGKSKKESVVREDEIRKAGSQELIDWVVKDGGKLADETGGSLVVGEIMLYAHGDKSAAIQTLLGSLATTPYPSPDPTSPHPIDLPHTSRMYKALLQGGHFNHTTRSITSTSFSPGSFASAFITVVGREKVVSMAKGEGMFVVAELLERVVEEGSEGDKTMLKGWFGEEVRKELESGNGRGKKVLLEKIAKLGS